MSSLGPLLLYSSRALPEVQFGFVSAESSDLAYGRTLLARQALEGGADWLLWLDADHSFPPDTLIRLLGRGKPVVGINQPRRVAPFEATALALDGSLLVTSSQTTGLIEAESTGMGVFLVAADALRKIGFPMFAGGSEDRFLCKRLRAAGFAIYVDQDLSREVAHIGEVEHRFTTHFPP
jgi:hypothetical protein